MYNFRVPARGEPIDLTLMTQMAQYITEVNTKLLEYKGTNSSLYGAVRLTVPTDHVSIWTGRVLAAKDVPKISDPSKLVAYQWTCPFDGANFTSVPIVTATAYCDTTGGGTNAANSVWLKEVTTTSCRGTFKFNQSPYRVETVYINIIAVGQGQVLR